MVHVLIFKPKVSRKRKGTNTIVKIENKKGEFVRGAVGITDSSYLAQENGGDDYIANVGRYFDKIETDNVGRLSQRSKDELDLIAKSFGIEPQDSKKETAEAIVALFDKSEPDSQEGE